MRLDRRQVLKGAAGIAAAPFVLRGGSRAWAADEIPVGVMYSLSGTTAIVEKSMNQCALMAIDEVRGEVRHWKDRCADLELQRQRDFQQLDAMLRLVSAQDKAGNKGLR